MVGEDTSEDRILTVKEVALRLNVGERTVRNLLNDGKLEGFKFGHQWRIPKSSFDVILKGSEPPRSDSSIPLDYLTTHRRDIVELGSKLLSQITTRTPGAVIRGWQPLEPSILEVDHEGVVLEAERNDLFPYLQQHLGDKGLSRALQYLKRDTIKYAKQCFGLIDHVARLAVTRQYAGHGFEQPSTHDSVWLTDGFPRIAYDDAIRVLIEGRQPNDLPYKVSKGHVWSLSFGATTIGYGPEAKLTSLQIAHRQLRKDVLDDEVALTLAEDSKRLRTETTKLEKQLGSHRLRYSVYTGCCDLCRTPSN
jgi:excisionase family DNA binding protein